MAAGADQAPRGFLALAVAAIAHALLLLGMDNYAEWNFVSTRCWLLLFWLWPLWPLLLVLHPARTLKRVSAPVVIGIALLVPCIPTAFMFTAWTIFGFAP
jgi:hypothetical protein